MRAAHKFDAHPRLQTKTLSKENGQIMSDIVVEEGDRGNYMDSKEDEQQYRDATNASQDASDLIVPHGHADNADNARRAFEKTNVDASRAYHDRRHMHPLELHGERASEDAHQTGGGMLKPVIFGGLDGILSSFAIIAGAAGGKLSAQVVLILGFSNIFADALSMGIGQFLSSKAENEWILSERRREEWELENYPQGESAKWSTFTKVRASAMKTLCKFHDGKVQGSLCRSYDGARIGPAITRRKSFET